MSSWNIPRVTNTLHVLAFHNLSILDNQDETSDSDSDTSSALGVEIIGDLIQDTIDIINTEDQMDESYIVSEEENPENSILQHVKNQQGDVDDGEEDGNDTIEVFDDLLTRDNYIRLNEIVTTKVWQLLISPPPMLISFIFR